MPNPSAFIALLLLAQNAAPADPVTVEGIVTNSITGAPIPRAHITLQGAQGRERVNYAAVSTADGKFMFPAVPPGTYAVNGARVAFVTSMEPGLIVRAGENKTGVEIKLVPCGVITGRVVDADGKPLEGASVTVQGPRFGAASQTDELGQFRVGGLTPDRYRISATLDDPMGGPPEIRTDGTVESHYATTYYPSALTEKQAGKVTVRAGAESGGVEIRMASVPFVRVSGKVTGVPPGASNFHIMAMRNDGGQGRPARPDGMFEYWRLDPGHYRLSAQWTTPDGSVANTNSVDIEVAGSNIDGIELRLAENLQIPGHLEFEDDRARQALGKDDAAASVALVGLENDESDFAPGQPDSDHRFVISDVQPAKYRVHLQPGTVYIKSIQLGSKTIDDGILDLTAVAPGTELSLLLKASTASLSGTVKDDSGNPAEASVVLTSDAFPFEPRYAESKTDGKYTVENLPPGDFQIAAVPKGEISFRYHRPTGFEDSMEAVTLHDGETITKDLTILKP